MFRRPIRLMFAAVALLTLACTDGTVTGSSAASSVALAPPGTAASLTVNLPKLPLGKLSCIIPDQVGVDIGPAGGTITLGGNTLTIPLGSLTKTTHILMLPLLDGSAGVRFLPEGLTFSPQHKPTLTLNTDCVGNPANAYIIYTDDAGNLKEVLKTTGRTAHTVSAELAHFSRYAVDW